MRVSLHKSVLDDPSCWDDLDQIIHYFDELKHAWHVDDSAEVENSEWLRSDINGRAGKRIRSTLVKSYTAAIYPNKSTRIEVTLNSTSAHQLTPKEACQCLRLPSKVLVENVSSDGEFLHFIIAAFKRKLLSDAYTAGWLEWDQMGGFGECEKLLNERLEQTFGPPRLFLVADSDRLYTGHLTKTMEKVIESCTKLGIPYAILTKRKIENYLPLDVLQQLNQDRYNAYLHLSQEQKDYYEMKKGFNLAPNGDAVIPVEQTALYQHVPLKVKRDLCGGFGKNVAQQFHDQKNKVQEQDIRVICATDPGEVDRILDQIESIL